MKFANFIPDYHHIVNAAKNIEPERVPLYEHNISAKIMEPLLGKSFANLIDGDFNDRKEYFKTYCSFFKEMGYDTVTFEGCIGEAMPGSGALGGHKPGVIKTREDFERYPWEDVPRLFFERYAESFDLIGEFLPEGMKAIGGPGNGVFECVQDVVGYESLCYISVDDEELYRDLFAAVGDMMFAIWTEFLKRYSSIYCVCRFGDDLGFRTNTLVSAEDIRELIIPQYARIIEAVHNSSRPFLLHSCGKIFNVMDDLIDIAKIDAKHSNEDQIAAFTEWVERYGSRIGNFGGIDTDHLCRKEPEEIKQLVAGVMSACKGHGGFALGSGNSIPDYVDPQRYLTMVETARTLRGD